MTSSYALPSISPSNASVLSLPSSRRACFALTRVRPPCDENSVYEYRKLKKPPERGASVATSTASGSALRTAVLFEVSFREYLLMPIAPAGLTHMVTVTAARKTPPEKHLHSQGLERCGPASRRHSRSTALQMAFPQGRIEASFHLLQRELKAVYNG